MVYGDLELTCFLRVHNAEDATGRSSYKDRLLKPGVDQGVEAVAW